MRSFDVVDVCHDHGGWYALYDMATFSGYLLALVCLEFDGVDRYFCDEITGTLKMGVA
jgi:hypothetical protein